VQTSLRFFSSIGFIAILIGVSPLAFSQNPKKDFYSKAELPALKIQTISAGTVSNQVLNYPFKIEYQFKLNADGVMAFYPVVVVKLPKDLKNIVVGSGSQSDFKGALLRLYFSNLTDTVELVYLDGSKESIQISLFYKHVTYIHSGCNQKQFTIEVPNKIEQNYYIAAFCESVKNGISVSITVPTEVSWGSSTVFEVAGKGERAKRFEFNQLSLSQKTDEIGRIEVLREGAASGCIVKIQPGQGAKDAAVENKQQFNGKIGLGYANMAATSSLGSSGNGGPFVFGAAHFIPQRPVWQGAASYGMVLPLDKNGQNLSAIHVVGERKMGELLGGLSFDSIASEAPLTNISFAHNQIGFELDYPSSYFQKKSKWLFQFESSGMFPKASSTWMNLNLFFDFSGKLKPFGMGFRYSSISFDSSAGDTFKSTALSLFAVFNL
jgi:hypothetical protein